MLLDDLKWRYATKTYQEGKKVPQEDIDKIIEAIRLAPTSSGLQPFRIIVIDDQETKEKLVEGVLNPKGIMACSHIIAFAAWDNYTPERIDEMYNLITDERGLPRGRYERYTDMIKEHFAQREPIRNFEHAARQAYIALGMALAQAAELKIDSTPVEGFDHENFDKVLGLEKLGLKSVVLMYVGYADRENDWLAPMKKVRISKEELVIKHK